MQVKSKSGRLFNVPSEQEKAQIREGIASDSEGASHANGYNSVGCGDQREPHQHTR